MPGRKILIMGLPGAGKTTLSRALAARLSAVHFNADEVRSKLNKDLGFTLADRIEQASRMGYLCDVVTRSGADAIADFVCPTEETRAAFGAAFTVWVDRIAAGRFDDTNRLFTPPAAFDVKVEAPGAASYWAERIARLLDTARYAEGLDASPVARRAFSMARTSQIETS